MDDLFFAQQESQDLRQQLQQAVNQQLSCYFCLQPMDDMLKLIRPWACCHLVHSNCYRDSRARSRRNVCGICRAEGSEPGTDESDGDSAHSETPEQQATRWLQEQVGTPEEIEARFMRNLEAANPHVRGCALITRQKPHSQAY